MKGGSRSILVQSNHFQDSGSRIVQIGGSTGLQYFRPTVMDYEAKDIRVAGNTFVGGEAQIAWVTAQEGHVYQNLFYYPQKWLGRILQESKDPQFEPSQNGSFFRNLIVTDERVRSFFNTGKGTSPESFVFAGNLWSKPERFVSRSLPGREDAGIYGVDPQIVADGTGQLQVTSKNPRVLAVGPWAYTPWKSQWDFDDIRLPPVELPIVVPEVKSVKAWLGAGTVVLVGFCFVALMGGLFLRPHLSLSKKRKRRSRRQLI
jgi:hypothetical protein